MYVCPPRPGINVSCQSSEDRASLKLLDRFTGAMQHVLPQCHANWREGSCLFAHIHLARRQHSAYATFH